LHYDIIEAEDEGMAGSPERLKIMKLVQDGKISAEEAIELLDMLPTRPEAEKTEAVDANPQQKSHPQWFRVVITDTITGKVRVNVKLPVSLINAGMKMGAKFSPNVNGIPQDQLAELIASGATGKVIDIVDEDEHLEVFIE
jgi:hypothetical protein